jgi:D-arabinose 1-dehydrogenase-like Zn-dependent alcohol dehydrogenase
MSGIMKSVVVAHPGGPLSMKERPIPEPGPGQLRIRIKACGICFSDLSVKEGERPGVTFPRVPGHEVAGVIDSTGPGITSWKPGERVGVGWHGYHCCECDECRSGSFITCCNRQITGIHVDGGYQQYMIASDRALARIPDAISDAEAAPILCAGVTTFNSLRHSGAMPGDIVAVQGIGGLGHMGIQFARQCGFRVVAISSGRHKEELAYRLGAHHFLDTSSVDPGAEITKLGRARVILLTAPGSPVLSSLVNSLSTNGKLIVIAGTHDIMQITSRQVISGRRSIQGWTSGTAKDSEDTLKFCALTGIRPMIEEFPLDDVERAFECMLHNKVRFRAVLVM